MAPAVGAAVAAVAAAGFGALGAGLTVHSGTGKLIIMSYIVCRGSSEGQGCPGHSI